MPAGTYHSGGLLLTVMFDVRLGCFGPMMEGMLQMAVRKVRMVRGLLMTSSIMVFGSFFVMMGSVLVMFSGLPVVLCGLFGHALLPLHCVS